MATYWVLTRGYQLESRDVTAALESLADSSDIAVQDEKIVRAHSKTFNEASTWPTRSSVTHADPSAVRRC